MDIKSELQKLYKLEQFSGWQNTFFYEDSVPAHTFVTVIKIVLDGSACLAFSARDSFDESLCTGMLAFLEEHDRSVSSIIKANQHVSILNEFHCEPYPFDCLLITNHEIVSSYGHEPFDPALTLATFNVDPVKRCELSGKETGDWAILLLRKIAPVNWKRKVRPLILVRHNNPKTKTGTKGKKSSLLDLDYIDLLLQEQVDMPKCFLEFRNYRDEFVHIVRKKDHYLVNYKGKTSGERAFPQREDLMSWVEKVVHDGLE